MILLESTLVAQWTYILFQAEPAAPPFSFIMLMLDS